LPFSCLPFSRLPFSRLPFSRLPFSRFAVQPFRRSVVPPFTGLEIRGADTKYVERRGFAAAASTVQPNEAAVGNTQWFDGGQVLIPPFAVLGCQRGLNAPVLISKPVPPRVLPFNCSRLMGMHITPLGC